MRILYVYFHSFEDMPYHVREWVEAAIGSGIEVVVVTSVSEEFLDSIGWTGRVEVRQVEYPGSGFVNNLKLSRRFAAAVAEELGKGEYDLVYERFSTVSPAVAKAVSARGVPHCVEINGIIENELKLSGASWARRAWFVRAQRAVFAEGVCVVAVTERIKEWIVERYGVPEKRVAAFSNGVNPERFKPMPKVDSRRRFGISEDGFVLGFLGSLYPWCGLDRLVEAASMMSEEERGGIFFMVGGGQEPMKSDLERLASEKGVSEIFLFSGRIPWCDAAEYISCFDVAVSLKLPTGGMSFSPLKLYAYMACSKPVLAADTLGMEDLKPRDVGLFLPPSLSPAEIADGIRVFRAMSDDERDGMGLRARRLSEERYSWKSIVEGTLKWFAEVSA